MNRNRHCTRRGAYIARFAFGVALVAGAAPDSRAQALAPQSEPHSEPQPWPEAETVLTLLRADAAAALADCRLPGICGPGTQPPPTMLPPVPARDQVRVAAIYGTARKLTVDLVVNGAQLRYQAGRADPVAGSAVMDAYRLLAIDGTCVRLHRDGRDHTACLDGEGARP